MHVGKLLRLVVAYVALWLFSFLCAGAIAETEIVKEYRYLVYLGVCLFLLAFAFFVCGVWLWMLRGVHKKLSLLAAVEANVRICQLQALLKRHKTQSFRALIGLNLVYAYLEAGEKERAFSHLALLRPKAPLYFDRTAYRRLLALCACMRDNRPLFDANGGYELDASDFPFLSSDVIERLRAWKGMVD